MHDSYIFICDCEHWQRTACAREIFYKEHEDKRYCVLHYPGTEKAADFKEALERKLAAADFDFRGVRFPDKTFFRNFSFNTEADFNCAEFSADADFLGAEFTAGADFRSARFIADAYFVGAQFKAEATFSDVQFVNAYFTGAQFIRAAFSGSTFSASVDFSGAEFKDTADFGHTQIEHASFMGTKFGGYFHFWHVRAEGAFFVDAIFSGPTSFSFTRFRDGQFNGSKFSSMASFGSAEFVRGAFFLTRFDRIAEFTRTQFSESADFDNASFSADADFSGAFFGNASFARTRFETTQFNNTQFSSHADFRDAIFSGNVYFKQAEFAEKDAVLVEGPDGNNKQDIMHVSFAGARFREGVRFEENIFRHPALLSFAAAVFEKPERVNFQTVALRPHWFVNVDSRKFNFINVDWGSLGRRDAVRQGIKALEVNDAANASRLLTITFRQLAVNAEENNRYEEAAHFRFMSMNAGRIERGYIQNLFSLSWWYWVLSGYGERVQRAFAVLLVIWLLFTFVYWSGNETWWRQKPETAIARLTFPEALIYSAGVMTLQKPEPLPAIPLVKALVLFETILGPLQAALLALAIRRKFMR
jgi:uncharacterized protein YjbI with pentapeptide repeats